MEIGRSVSERPASFRSVTTIAVAVPARITTGTPTLTAGFARVTSVGL